MMRMLLATSIVVVAMALSSCARRSGVTVVSAEGPGRIEGAVIYEDGLPAKGATVSASPLDWGLAAKVPSQEKIMVSSASW